ncbi:hypothetical protein [Streptomyces sp. 840.1]|nr:hypothetical protein [Streptomyces sp. 840.1]
MVAATDGPSDFALVFADQGTVENAAGAVRVAEALGEVEWIAGEAP